MRMTKSILRAKVNNLNSKLELNGVGEFVLDYTYGGVRLVKLTNEHGGVVDVSERVSKSEMGRILDAIYNVAVRYK